MAMSSTSAYEAMTDWHKERLEVNVQDRWHDDAYDQLLEQLLNDMRPSAENQDMVFRAALAALALDLEKDDDVQALAEENGFEDVEMFAGWAAWMYGQDIAKALAADYVKAVTTTATVKSRLTRTASVDAITADDVLMDTLRAAVDGLCSGNSVNTLTTEMEPADDSAEEIFLAACEVAEEALLENSDVHYVAIKTTTPVDDVARFAIDEFGYELLDDLTRSFVSMQRTWED